MSNLSKLDAVRATASVLVGMGTGGVLGAAVKMVTSKNASFQNKVLLLGAAAIATGAILNLTGWGSILFLGGWLKSAMYGTTISWLIAPSNVAQAKLQDMRGTRTANRYLTK